MRTLISALAAAGLLLAAAAPIATADDETTTTTPTTTSTTTATPTEEPTETTTTTESTAVLLGPHDLMLAGLTFTPDKKTYAQGDTITTTVTIRTEYFPETWAVEGSFPEGITITGHTGLAEVETAKNMIKGHSEGTLDPGTTATVTVTVRADAETSGPVTFRVSGASSDYHPENNTKTRAIVVAKTPPPAPQKPAPQPKLAETGASATAPLLAGGVLVLLGGGLLVAVRRRNT